MDTIQDLINIKDQLPKCYRTYQLVQINQRNGRHFFSPDSMRFFSSRVHDTVYGGCIFVTSEKGWDDIRAYTVRAIDNKGNIYTLGEFQEYSCRASAHAAASRLAKQLK